MLLKYLNAGDLFVYKDHVYEVILPGKILVKNMLGQTFEFSDQDVQRVIKVKYKKVPNGEQYFRLNKQNILLYEIRGTDHELNKGTIVYQIVRCQPNEPKKTD